MKRFLFAVSFLCATSLALASVIHVPASQPTIQAGINAAVNGDMVLVAPGTYKENINFNGKAITVKSSNGAKVTIINGGNIASVVTFSSGETLKSVLAGFTLQHGNPSFSGGGVNIQSASPTIRGNVIQNNTACEGGGINSTFGSPVIQGNTISFNSNSKTNCLGNDGAGISIGGTSAAKVIGNVIANNSAVGDGGGIMLFDAGTPTLMNNIIVANTAKGSSSSQGGGIWIVNQSDALIVQNLIYNNNADQGGGIYFAVPSSGRGPILTNNTIAGNIASQGSAVFAAGYSEQTVFFNNIMLAPSGGNAVDCSSAFPPIFTNNDAFSAGGAGLLGTCSGQSSQNGNISADPRFVNAVTNQYKLATGSPAINAGKNSAPNLPAKDLSGKPRIVNGTVDMGVYEF